jgi:hypothetical protein
MQLCSERKSEGKRSVLKILPIPFQMMFSRSYEKNYRQRERRRRMKSRNMVRIHVVLITGKRGKKITLNVATEIENGAP